MPLIKKTSKSMQWSRDEKAEMDEGKLKQWVSEGNILYVTQRGNKKEYRMKFLEGGDCRVGKRIFDKFYKH